MNKEQKAREYAESVPQFDDRKRYCIEDFCAGWDEALKSQWVSTKERLPAPNIDVIFITDLGMVINGCYNGNTWMQMDGAWGSAYVSIDENWDVIAWMPIPSFYKILEDSETIKR